jgi:hypothetical protein
MRRQRVIILSAVLTVLVGCQQTERAPEPPPPSAQGSAASAPKPKPGDRIDAHGIVLDFVDGGAIKLSGRDRWGNALDTTYENIEFLRKALPVLERSVTAEQAAGLRAVVTAP